MFNNWNNPQSYYYQQPRFQPAVPQAMPQQPTQQVMQQPKPISELPIVNVIFATEQEANSYLPQPNTRVLLINRDREEAYLKSADVLGQTYIEPFVYKSKSNIASKQESVEKKTVKKEKVEYITKTEFEASISKLSKDLQELTERFNKEEVPVNE